MTRLPNIYLQQLSHFVDIISKPVVGYRRTKACNKTSQKDFTVLEWLDQGSTTYGPPRHFTRLATFYCHPACDLFSFFNDTYAAIYRRNDSHLLAKTFFCSPRHRFVFFFLVFAINSAEKGPEFLAKIFLFWSAGMVAACCNFVRTECGPLVQKAADPWVRP